MADVVMVVAALCLAIIVMGLIFPASRPFATTFGLFVFIALAAVGIGVLAYVGWILARYALRRRRDAVPSVDPEITEVTEV
jgi:hypothetical protein